MLINETITAAMETARAAERRAEQLRNITREPWRPEQYPTIEERKAAHDAMLKRTEDAANELAALEIETKIRHDNLRRMIYDEVLPIALDILRKYNGKPYGEKTADKIRAEVRAAGYSFYFEGYHNSRLVIYELNTEGYKTPRETETTAGAYDEAGHIQYFITEDNKLNIANVIIKPWRDKYTENPAKEAAKIAKAIQAYSEATREIEKKRGALSAMLPEGIAAPEYIKEYRIIF